MARRSARFSAKEILALIVGTALACTFVIIVAGIIVVARQDRAPPPSDAKPPGMPPVAPV